MPSLPDMLLACRFGRSPMVSNMVTTWQERMLDCVGLPKNVVAPAETINVAVVDRSYSAGRAFLNLPDLVDTLQVSEHMFVPQLSEHGLDIHCQLLCSALQQVLLTVQHSIRSAGGSFVSADICPHSTG